MRRIQSQTSILFLAISLTIPMLGRPQTPIGESLTGEWHLTTVVLGVSFVERLQIAAAGNEITGKLYRQGESVPVKCALKGQEIRLEFKAGNEESVYLGTIAASAMSGSFTTKSQTQTDTGTWSAKRSAMDKPVSPRTLGCVGVTPGPGSAPISLAIWARTQRKRARDLHGNRVHCGCHTREEHLYATRGRQRVSDGHRPFRLAGSCVSRCNLGISQVAADGIQTAVQKRPCYWGLPSNTTFRKLPTGMLASWQKSERTACPP
jgi:hypothetical protein